MKLPEHIGPYRVLRSIASGGMAQVYEVQDTGTEERYALKLLTAPVALKRFNREYEAMTRLNHPGIVRVYHYGLHEGLPWLTMELLRGVPAQVHLKERTRGGSPERLREALRICYFIANALHYVHDRGLVHRDLKSANALVLPDDRVKLIDFGTAHLVDALERITIEGEFVGTWAYASPEQVTGKPVDARSDLYSLGILMYRLVTGKRPFPGNEGEELVYQHTTVMPADPRSITPELTPALAKLMMDLLAKQPGDRPENAGIVARAIEELAGTPFSTRGRLAVHTRDVVARSRERKEIADRLATKVAGELLVVAGDDGSDRARLADRAVRDAMVLQWQPVVGVMVSDADVQALLPMLEAASEGAGPAAAGAIESLRRLVPTEKGAPVGSRAQISAAAGAVLLARAERGPLLFALLELHRARPGVVGIVAAMQRMVKEASAQVTFLTSARSSAVLAETEAGRWLRDGLVVTVGPLGPRGVAIAVGAMLGRRPPPAELARRLHLATGGQPLYVEEAVEQLVRSGGIEAEDNRIEWGESTLDVAMPAQARQVAEDLVFHLPVLHLQLLQALVLLGDAADLESLAAAIGWDADEVALLIRDIAGRGAIDVHLGWRVTTARPVVEETLTNVRRLAIARAVVPVLRARPPTLALVTLLLLLDRVDDAVKYAAELAKTLGASRSLRELIDLLEPVVFRASAATPSRDLAEVRLAYGQAVLGVRPTDPAASRALAAARKFGEGDARVRARAELATARLQAVIGHYRNYARNLAEAWKSLQGIGDGMLRATVAIEIGRSHLLQGSLTQAEQWYARAQTVSLEDGNLELAGASLVGYASCQYARGQTEAAESSATLALQTGEQAGDRPGYWTALAMWAQCLRRQGRYSEALSKLYQRMPEASQWPDPGPYVNLLLATAWCELDLARLGRAQECVDELAAVLQKGEYLHLRLEAGLVSGQILLASGQYRDAAWSLQETERRALLAELTVIAGRARGLHGQTIAELGDRELARSLLQSACLGLFDTGDLASLSDAAVGRARAFEGEEDPAVTFHGVLKLEDRPLPLFQLELLLARSGWHHSRGERGAAMISLRKAAIVLNRVASGLNDTDRAALRVHPWSRRIRAALASLATDRRTPPQPG